MQSSTGRWVVGEDFFDRVGELRALEASVRDGNHVLLTGQRRMGKTSVARELGRRLEASGWISLFVDVESANSEEDVVADIARSMHPIRPLRDRAFNAVRNWFVGHVDEIGGLEFRVKFRAGLNSGNWRHHGENLLGTCAGSGKRVLLVIDELPIFLKRLLRDAGGRDRADIFLSWLRGCVQNLGSESPVLLISGSIGLQPLVRRLGIPDRINHLFPFRLGPWDRATTVQCFESLAQHQGLSVENGVADAVYEALGIGIPHQVQSYFARLKDFATMRDRSKVTLADIKEVYRNELLGPSGQSDLAHYEARLSEALEDPEYTLAMEILAETAIQGTFTRQSRQCLIRLYSALVDDVGVCIVSLVELLEHDGYIEKDQGSYSIPSRLLKDWWSARFKDHHTPLRQRHQGGPREA